MTYGHAVLLLVYAFILSIRRLGTICFMSHSTGVTEAHSAIPGRWLTEGTQKPLNVAWEERRNTPTYWETECSRLDMETGGRKEEGRTSQKGRMACVKAMGCLAILSRG